MTDISATDAARRFSDLLNRARYRGESFTIVRGGEAVARLSPPDRPEGPTLTSLSNALRAAPAPDDAFADDLEEIQRAQPGPGAGPWDS